MDSTPEGTLVAGVDFTSAPSRRKPIVVATGRLRGHTVELESIDAHTAFDGFAAWLNRPGPWIGAFDFPFGLPRELVRALGWPLEWSALVRHYAALPRPRIRDAFAAFCAARPPGAKFAHRACDIPAGSSPSMKWVNPPVAWMLHAGAPLLLEAGVHIPGLRAGDPRRVALEGYPGMLARELIGRRSYKSDDRRRQTGERRAARVDLLDALGRGHPRLGLRLRLGRAQRDALVEDGAGDRLDAGLCLVLAAWAATRPAYGLPPRLDPLEGWIVGAPAEPVGASG
jgi:hypothetical protein